MNDVRLPDCAVSIAIQEYEIATVVFFAGKTPHDDIEIVGGIEDRTQLPHVVAILEAAIRSLKSAEWHSLDELDSRPDEDKNSPPF